MPNAEHIAVRELCRMRSGLMDAYNAPQLDTVTFTVHSTVTLRQQIAIAVTPTMSLASSTRGR